MWYALGPCIKQIHFVFNRLNERIFLQPSSSPQTEKPEKKTAVFTFLKKINMFIT